MRIVRLGVLPLLVPGVVFAQAEKPCFAFLLKGDVSVSCGGTVTQVTRLGDVDEFAVSGEHSTLGYTTSAVTKRTGSTAVSISTTTLVDLKSGMIRRLVGDDYIVNTCGGLFWGREGVPWHSGTHELIEGQELTEPPYNWFRCSSDRRVVVGTSGEAGSDLYEGIPPRTKIATPGSFFKGTFSVSASGSYVAYFADGSPVCVVSPPAPKECAPQSAALPDAPSVDDAGHVLFTVETPQWCIYKTSSNFSPEGTSRPTGEHADVCLAVGYWRPDLKSVEIVAPLGRNPQWISPATAEILRSWAAQPSGRK
jgi:hypothetical protein